jgi:DNA-binding MarR family transcriptional regulator
MDAMLHEEADGARQPGELANLVWERLIAAAVDIIKDFGARAQWNHSEFAMYGLLVSLLHAGTPLTAKELGMYSLSTQSANSLLMHRCEQRGLITISQIPEDKRIRLIALTDEGAEFVSRMDQQCKRVVPPLIASRLTPDEQASLEKLLSKFSKLPSFMEDAS